MMNTEDKVLRERIKYTLVAAALVVVPSSTVFTIEEAKLQQVSDYYEQLIQASNESAYLNGFYDGIYNGMFGNGDEEPMILPDEEDEIIGSIDRAPRKKARKTLILTSKINK